MNNLALYLFIETRTLKSIYDFYHFTRTNRDIFGRELWLAVYLNAQQQRIGELWNHWSCLIVREKITPQWGRELWLCAWMLAWPTIIRGEEYAQLQRVMGKMPV